MNRLVIKAAVLFAALVASVSSAPAWAQASPFTSAARYDAAHRVTGTIAPDPDGSTGPIHYAAVRNSYDAAGRLIRVEKGELSDWQSEAVAPANWGNAPSEPSSFTIFSQVDSVYDALGHKLKDSVSASGTVYQVTQYSYDQLGRLLCTAVRMNRTVYGNLPSDACTLSTTGSDGPDRITKTVYNALGDVLRVQKAYGVTVANGFPTTLQQDYTTYSYTANGKPASVFDANGNKASYTYDGLDRLVRWNFPDQAAVGAVNLTDYEEYGYDPNGSRTSLRKRDGRTITYTYDALNRVTAKTFVGAGACVAGYACTTPPSWAARNIYTGYDLRGLQTYARFDSPTGSDTVNQNYDGFGRLSSSTVTMGGVSRKVSYAYDADGNTILMKHPDNTQFASVFDGLDRPTAIKLNSVTQIVSQSYYAQGAPYQLARGGVLSTYSYDPIMRLSSLADILSGTAANTTATFTYNPASQIVKQERPNDSYVFAAYTPASTPYGVNGLNQYATVGAGSLGYDSNGNLASTSGTSFTYDVENRLVAATGTLATAMAYDPMGRLYQTSSTSGIRQFLYDGDARIAEYDGSSGTLLRRYVHGTGADDPLIWYEGSGLTDMRSLQSDHQGSIISVANASGALLAIKTYDEYGVPAGDDVGAFQYTGQAYLPDLGMYYYKARIYASRLGRFLQTDPIGYKDQMDLYAYVGNDPVDGRDPTGEVAQIGSCGGDSHGNVSSSSCSGASVLGALVGHQIANEKPQTFPKDVLESAPGEKSPLTIAAAASSIIRGAGICLLTSSMCGLSDNRVTLYRAVDPAELRYLRQTGNYGFPISGGKYFAMSAAGVKEFMKTYYNADRHLTLTRFTVPIEVTFAGHKFHDAGGAGPSFYYSNDKLPVVYGSMSRPEIIHGVQ